MNFFKISIDGKCSYGATLAICKSCTHLLKSAPMFDAGKVCLMCEYGGGIRRCSFTFHSISKAHDNKETREGFYAAQPQLCLLKLNCLPAMPPTTMLPHVCVRSIIFTQKKKRENFRKRSALFFWYTKNSNCSTSPLSFLLFFGIHVERHFLQLPLLGMMREGWRRFSVSTYSVQIQSVESFSKPLFC